MGDPTDPASLVLWETWLQPGGVAPVTSTHPRTGWPGAWPSPTPVPWLPHSPKAGAFTAQQGGREGYAGLCREAPSGH